MFDAYKNLQSHTKDFAFGYTDNQGTNYCMSVTNKKTGRSVIKYNIALHKTPQDYVNLWGEMLTELKQL